MAQARTCPRCGTSVEDERLDGLCPECLLGDGAALEDFDEELETGDMGTHGSSATSVAGNMGTRGSSALPRFGDYELLEVIAHGGMGIVYKARQVSLNRTVALKMLLFGAHSNAAAVQRLRAEAIAAASLHHPNIVAIHEVGFCEGQHFLAMDYIEGRPLSALIAGKPVPPRRTATYLRTIAEAVHHAHENRILHRDLKPSNVLIDQEDQPRITDFGLAKRLESGSNLTVSGQVLGSPNYMSPEQAAGKRGVLTRRSDIYSLGAMFYEMLTGRPPFIGDGLGEIVPQVLNTEPIAPRALNPGVPRDLETVCLKCLEKEPEKRYATALALAEEMGRYLEGMTVLARPVGRLAKGWRWCRRNPVIATLAAAVVLLFALGFGGVSWQARVAGRARDLARQSEYGADIRLAQQALEAGDIGLAVGTLDKHRPVHTAGKRTGPRSRDLRDWEWRYLAQECQQSQRSPLFKYEEWIDAMKLSSDGRYLALRVGTNRVVVCDLQERRSLAELPAPGPRRARTLAFVPDSHWLAVGSMTGTQPEIVIWDAIANEEKERFPVDRPVRALSFTSDARHLAILHEKGAVTVLDMASKKGVKQFSTERPMEVNSGDIVFTPDGARLIVGIDGRVTVSEWQTDCGPRAMPFLGEERPGLMALAASPTNNLIAWSKNDPGSVIWAGDCATGELSGLLGGHKNWVVALAFSPDGKRLASAGGDHTIRVWDLSTRKQVRLFQGHHDQVWGVAFLPDGHTLVTTGRDGSVRLWDIDAPERSPGHQVLPRAVLNGSFSFTPDGQQFVTVFADRVARLWDTHTVREIEKLSFLGTNLLSASFSGTGLAVLSRSGRIGVWDWRTRQAITNLQTRPAESGRAYFVGGHLTVYTGTYAAWREGTWLPEDGPPDFARMGIALAPVSPTADKWASGDREGKIKLWTFPDNQLLKELPGRLQPMNALAFSPDGRLLAAAGGEAWVYVYDAMTYRLAFRIRAHDGYLRSVCFSPNARRLVIFSSVSAEVWDFETQRHLLTLPLETTTVGHLFFSPDGDTLACRGTDGRVELWHAPTLAELDAPEGAKISPVAHR